MSWIELREREEVFRGLDDDTSFMVRECCSFGDEGIDFVVRDIGISEIDGLMVADRDQMIAIEECLE